MKILLDADMLLFRVTSATEVEVRLEDDVWTRHSELPEAREMYWDQCEAWCKLVNCTLDDVLHCFSDRSAFRKAVDPSYKANRKGKPKPIGYKALKDELLQEKGAWLHRQIEADDLIGIFATMPDIAEDGILIASLDKDLNQIPGDHVWIDNTIRHVTPDEAERFTYKQYLCGDPTDGVPGCPSIGEKRAEEIVSGFDLAQPVDCWEEVVRTYEKKGKVVNASEVATQQARLVRILRYREYDFTTHEVRLWNPPTR